MNKTIFFDRDGIVNTRITNDYVKNTAEFHFLPDFLKFFKEIKAKGFLAILISNQQGVGKGVMSDEQLQNISNFMQEHLFKITGFKFDDLFYCTDLAETNSFNRKPNPGMIIKAIEKWSVFIDKSWMIGDSPSDVRAGKKVGLNTILVGKFSKYEHFDADIVLENLYNATKSIDNF